MISIIAASARNRVIGKGNQIPWSLPADLDYFKKTTLGHGVVMGRKTLESIGYPLPGRKNIVLTHDLHYKPADCVVVHSLPEILALHTHEELFIIGGEMVYQAFIPFAEKIYLTQIDVDIPGDRFFPSLDDSWKLFRRVPGKTDPSNPYPYAFLYFQKEPRSKKERKIPIR